MAYGADFLRHWFTGSVGRVRGVLHSDGQTFAAAIHFLQIDWLNQPTRVQVAVSPNITEAVLGGQMLSDCLLLIDYYNRSVRIVRRTPVDGMAK